MEKIVGEGFSSTEWVIVATGDSFPDALSAAPIAGTMKCPVVLTSGTSLSPEAANEIRRLGADLAFIVGGTASVSPSVQNSIESLGVTVSRLAGSDRVETSLCVLEMMKGVSDTVVLASGDSFPDALSIGPWCWKNMVPIVLCRSGMLSDAAVSKIKSDPKITKVVIVGGTSSVSDTVKSQLGSGYNYMRLGGADRYQTSCKIADWSTLLGLNWSTPLLATGANFPDALAGAALAGAKGVPLLLVSSSSESPTIMVNTHSSEVSQLIALGGESSLPSAVLSKVAGSKESAQQTYRLRYDLKGLIREGGSGDIGGIYVPATMADYRSYYGSNGNLVVDEYFVRGSLGGGKGTVPGTNIKIQYFGEGSSGEAGAEAVGIEGPLCYLVEGISEEQSITAGELADRLQAKDGAYDVRSTLYSGQITQHANDFHGNNLLFPSNVICISEGSNFCRELTLLPNNAQSYTGSSTARYSTYTGIMQ